MLKRWIETGQAAMFVMEMFSCLYCMAGIALALLGLWVRCHVIVLTGIMFGLLFIGVNVTRVSWQLYTLIGKLDDNTPNRKNL